MRGVPAPRDDRYPGGEGRRELVRRVQVGRLRERVAETQHQGARPEQVAQLGRGVLLRPVEEVQHGAVRHALPLDRAPLAQPLRPQLVPAQPVAAAHDHRVPGADRVRDEIGQLPPVDRFGDE